LSKKDKKQTIIVDIKLNDIPNTCVSAVNSVKEKKNIKYLTVHINGGSEMLKTIKKAAKKNK
jgi:orotidine-5'-phosphate decarboxylase